MKQLSLVNYGKKSVVNNIGPWGNPYKKPFPLWVVVIEWPFVKGTMESVVQATLVGQGE
jgi:hypothetical protein